MLIWQGDKQRHCLSVMWRGRRTLIPMFVVGDREDWHSQ